jgi:hypothetical protein
VTMGKIADILQQRGETEEALRIRREEVLPVFERLGDLRERAMTMGKIADILQQRGETEEALRIHLEERLPVAEKIGDLEGLAHIRFSCARIRLERGGFHGGEAQAILDELAESFAILQKVRSAHGIAIVGRLLGEVLARVGRAAEALEVLEQSATAFEKLQLHQQAAQVRELQQSIRTAQP